MKGNAKGIVVEQSSNRPRGAHFVSAAAIAIALSAAAVSYNHQSKLLNPINRTNPDGIELVALDPEAFEGEAHISYQIARQHPKLLAELYCYCRCDTRLGHRNLLDCYRDSHAASCGICMGEARDAEQLENRGLSPEEIRATLKARYENQE